MSFQEVKFPLLTRHARSSSVDTKQGPLVSLVF